MALSLHTLAPAEGRVTHAFRLGRGPGSGRGKTAGRGTKGQRSRSGGKNKLILKGMKQMLLSFPKNRGFRSLMDKVVALPVSRLEQFDNGTTIDRKALNQAHLTHTADHRVKFIAGDKLTKKVIVVGIAMTEGARKMIEAAGGSVRAKNAK